MYSRRVLPVWFGIIALCGVFLMGEDAWPPCIDADSDGYGNPGYFTCRNWQQDCDDNNPDVYPGAPELCDGIDNQCPLEAGYGEDPGYGVVDEGCDMVWIPEGLFLMGDFLGEGFDDEFPLHYVMISEFEMDATEVTSAQYQACVDAGSCSAPVCSSNGDDHPVVCVDWNQATEYCGWAGKRLPTEAEWEYAARGGLMGMRYPWGDEIFPYDANYWDSGDPYEEDMPETTPVGFYPANGYGLYDMAGNVWEWVSDWYADDYYQDCSDRGIVTDPQGPPFGTSRVFRGGSWLFYTLFLRVAIRASSTPDYEFSNIGFRCAR